MLTRIGNHILKQPICVIGTWLVCTGLALWAVIFGFGTSGSIFQTLQPQEQTIANSESALGSKIEQTNQVYGMGITYAVSGMSIKQEKIVDIDKAIKPIRDSIVTINGVAKEIDPFIMPTGSNTDLTKLIVSEKQDGFLINVWIKKTLTPELRDAAYAEVIKVLDQVPAALKNFSSNVKGYVFSDKAIAKDIVGQVKIDLFLGVSIAVVLAVILLFVLFGSLYTAILPVIVAIVSIFTGLGILYLISFFITFDSFATNLLAIIGLGITIDYSIVVITRFVSRAREIINSLPNEAINNEGAISRRTIRKQARQSRRKIEEIVQTAVLDTISAAGYRLSLSALIIMVAALGILLMGVYWLQVLGLVIILVVLVALCSSITLLPAFLFLFGNKFVKAKDELRKAKILPRIFKHLSLQRRFASWAVSISKRPKTAFVGAIILLFVLASPVINLHLHNSTTDMLPTASNSYKALEVISNDYPASKRSGLRVVAHTKPANTTKIVQDINQIAGVQKVNEPTAIGTDHTSISVQTNYSDDDAAKNNQIVYSIRQLSTDYKFYVTGSVASQADITYTILQHLPIAIFIVGLALLVILFLVTGSVILPLKALVINLLVIISSLGVVVFIFEGGYLGITRVAGLPNYVVAVVIAFGFGLAMDYEVFMLSRMKEYRTQGYRGREILYLSFQKTGRVFSSAAALLVAIFCGFIVSDTQPLKEVGLAIAITVLIDATLVRGLLVPSTMYLFDKWNWWTPKLLENLYQRYMLKPNRNFDERPVVPNAPMPTPPSNL